MPIDTKEKRAAVFGVGRPWMRDKFPVATPDDEWRISSGNAYGGNALTATGLVSITFESTDAGVSFASTQATVTFAGGTGMGCITRLSDNACEESTYGITVSFTDEDDVAMTPDTLTWSLYTTAGVTVNAKSGEVLTPAESVTIVLSGDDLAILANDNRFRRVTVEGTYTSDLGSGLPLKAECEFMIGDLVGV